MLARKSKGHPGRSLAWSKCSYCDYTRRSTAGFGAGTRFIPEGRRAGASSQDTLLAHRLGWSKCPALVRDASEGLPSVKRFQFRVGWDSEGRSCPGLGIAPRPYALRSAYAPRTEGPEPGCECVCPWGSLRCPITCCRMFCRRDDARSLYHTNLRCLVPTRTCRCRCRCRWRWRC